MDADDRAAIERLFQRLAEVAQSAPPRDPEAERLIAERLGRQPGAAYHLAQTVVAQEQALAAARARIEELERQAGPSSAGPGGFRSPWSRPATSAGRGFLAGAAQTAVGVAGGVLLANALGGLFGGPAEAAAPPVDDVAPDGFDDFDF